MAAPAVESFQRFLLQSYETALFTEVDEVVATDPRCFEGTLADYCAELAASPDAVARCTGFEVIHDPEGEPPLDWSAPVLRQRTLWSPSSRYRKTLLAKVPPPGSKASIRPKPPATAEPDPRLLLLHLHRAD